jgi:hypothetical protein
MVLESVECLLEVVEEVLTADLREPVGDALRAVLSEVARPTTFIQQARLIDGGDTWSSEARRPLRSWGAMAFIASSRESMTS